MTRTLARSAAALAAFLAVSCGPSSSRAPDATYRITLRYCSAASTTSCQEPTEEEFRPEWRAVFQAQADRIQRTITAGLVPVDVNRMSCGRGIDAIPIDEDVHGLLILVSVRDLAFGTLAQSGPCIIRSGSRLPLVSVMRFNSDYVSSYYTSGKLGTVVLHEMFHTVGFGTVWADVSPSRLAHVTTDPAFTGPQALAAGKAHNHAPSTWTSVPVEDLGGTGTVLSHWRQSTFQNELMTGWIEDDVANPLSAMTLASLADLGYEVVLDEAEAYTVPTPPSPGAALRFPSATAVYVGDDVLPDPPAVADEQ